MLVFVFRGIVLSCLLLCALPFPAGFAQLNLTVTQGLSDTLSIGIGRFFEDPNMDHSLRDVVIADLNHSGRFHAEPLSSASDTTSLDYFLTGSATLQKSQYQVAFGLFEGGGHTQRALTHGHYLVAPQALRTIAHRIADEVYQQLLGTPGSFSTRLAYVLVNQASPTEKQYLIELSDADGFNAKTLLTSPQPLMSPAFSPDGQSIAYVSFEGNRSAVYIQDIRTGKRFIASKHMGINGAPAWSHDGHYLALVLSKDGYPKIYTLQIKTGQLKQITRGNAIDTEPSWGRDDQSLIFTSNRGGSPQIYRISLRDGQVERLTFSGDYNAKGSLSQDGKYLSMLHRDSGHFHIAIQNLATGHIKKLTESDWDESPSLSPSANMIVYATRLNDQEVLGIVSTDGHVTLHLPSSQGVVREPVWSPLTY